MSQFGPPSRLLCDCLVTLNGHKVLTATFKALYVPLSLLAETEPRASVVLRSSSNGQGGWIGTFRPRPKPPIEPHTNRNRPMRSLPWTVPPFRIPRPRRSAARRSRTLRRRPRQSSPDPSKPFTASAGDGFAFLSLGSSLFRTGLVYPRNTRPITRPVFLYRRRRLNFAHRPALHTTPYFA